MAAVGIGPSKVALDTDHPAASELIITTALHAAQPAADIVIGPIEERTIERPVNELPVYPQATDVAANVAAGPVEVVDRRRWRRWRRWPLNGRTLRSAALAVVRPRANMPMEATIRRFMSASRSR